MKRRAVPLELRRGGLSSPAVSELLREHLEEMHEVTPPGSVHALDLDGLREAEVTFWSAWRGAELVGCGGLKELDSRNGEIKSMRTARAHRRQGVAAAILEHIIAEARARNYENLYLETGSLEAFAPARAFYRRFGFAPCGPFADYADDPNSAFMRRVLAASPLA